MFILQLASRHFLNQFFHGHLHIVSSHLLGCPSKPLHKLRNSQSPIHKSTYTKNRATQTEPGMSLTEIFPIITYSIRIAVGQGHAQNRKKERMLEVGKFLFSFSEDFDTFHIGNVFKALFYQFSKVFYCCSCSRIEFAFFTEVD